MEVDQEGQAVLYHLLPPPCTIYSSLQALNTKHWTKEEYEATLAKAMQHVKICMEVCHFQMREHRFFVYEHPAEARSWLLKEVEALRKTDGVHTAEFVMCRFDSELATTTESYSQ